MEGEKRPTEANIVGKEVFHQMLESNCQDHPRIRGEHALKLLIDQAPFPTSSDLLRLPLA